MSELYHYGILGMKWGVRRTPEQLARARKSSSEKVHDDYKKAHDSKSVKEMSDDELRSRLNRLNMEQQYTKLNPSSVRNGKNFINKVISDVDRAASTADKLTRFYQKGKEVYPHLKKFAQAALATAVIANEVRKFK